LRWFGGIGGGLVFQLFALLPAPEVAAGGDQACHGRRGCGNLRGEVGGVEEVRRPEEHDRTPLHYAVKRGPIMVKTLLKHGADPDVADDSGTTPLHIAAMLRRHGERDMTQMPEMNAVM